MVEIEFIFNGNKTKISCNPKDKLKNIFQKFKDIANLNGNKLFFSYDGNLNISGELTFEEMANKEDKIRKSIIIIVLEIKDEDIIKSKNIICPICKENIKMDIKDYKINLFGCKNRHRMENILLDKFEKYQITDNSKIICDICKKNNKKISYNYLFYYCVTCKMNICPLCKLNHNNEHGIINYDKKNYTCDRHINESYNSYCERCRRDICTLCSDHRNHKRIEFSDILPSKEDLLQKKKELKDSIILLYNDINMIIKMLEEVINKINIYYKINEDIINSYNERYRNYETIYYLNQFKNNNILQELNKIIKCNYILDKFNNIFNLFSKMNIDDMNIVYKVKEKTVKLFGKNFARRYKKNCKLLIDGKEHELNESFSFGFFDKEKKILNVKLKGITNITNASGMFYECKSLLSLPDISKWNTSNITNMQLMFYECTLLSSLPDISKWDISNVNNISYMFNNCSSLKFLPDISKWNTYNVNNMSHIFNNCSSLNSLPDISKWNTSNVNNMSYMFCNCSLLSSLPNISNWNTKNVSDFSDMFYWCLSLNSLPDISKWNTSNATNMSYMFCNCESLISLPDISLWDTSKVTDMSHMFSECSSLSVLPNISKWNISEVLNINGFLCFCSSLLSLPDISRWDISKFRNMEDMFLNCNKNLNIPDKFIK